MADVEMKDAAKPAAEEEKKEETKVEEPTDNFYGKLHKHDYLVQSIANTCFLWWTRA